MRPEIRALFGGRGLPGQAAAFLGVGLGALVLGLALGSLGRQLVSTRLAQVEAVNLELRETAAALEAELREARAPLQRRIQELEVALGESPGAAPPVPLAPEPSEAEQALRERVASLEAAAKRDGARRGELEKQIARLEASVKSEKRDRGTLKAENQRLARRIGELEQDAAAPAPAQAASPAARAPAPQDRARPDAQDEARAAGGGAAVPAKVAAAPGAAAARCGPLVNPDFDLAVSGAPERRLGGRLVMRLAESAAGLDLELGEQRERYAIRDTPQHVSFDCAGTPYIVSVCRVDRAIQRAAGVVQRSAERWRDPCL